MMQVTSFAIVLFILVSCGKNSSTTPALERVVDEQVTDGQYRAILRPLNTQASGFIPSGAAEIKVEGNDFKVKSFLDDDAKVPHLQSIHTGKRCPNLSDDTNGDGFIDYQEALSVVGPVLIPLDGDLNTIEAGKDIYPLGSSFTYQKNASLLEMLKDLGATKILAIQSKVFLIHGTADLGRLPPSVRSDLEKPPHLALPVACGLLKRQ
jgi:hypothetical protein